MNKQEYSALTDKELLQQAKKLRSTSIMNAFLVGFLIGIIVFSVVKNTWGLVSLVPLFIVYKIVNKPMDERKALEEVIKERNLK